MIPTYRYSISSPMPIDLNEDHNPHFFSQHQAYSPSSSLTYPTFYNPDQDQPGSHYWESKPSQSNEEAEKSIPSGGSWDHSTEKVERNMKLTVWKKEERDEENQAEHNGSSKWMSSKMRIMQKMMVSDHQTGSSNVVGSSAKKSEDQKQPLSPLGTENSSKSCSYNSNITVRVCSDCHTTKTPLWRSGPRGPKSLCNACGIRQRKARRAMAAAAASANGTILAAEASPFAVRKLQNKEKKAKINGCSPQLKKKRKLGAKPISQEREKFGFEDFRISLSKKLAVQHVFPQDEKEAAILLMALSYGLVHG